MQLGIFAELTLALVMATGAALVFRLFRQPLIIGYILAGLIIGPSVLNLVHSKEAFESFSQIGVALLLFLIGLGMNPAVIRRTGAPVGVSFVITTLLLGGTGFVVSRLLGLTPVESLVMAIALLFSSTIVVLKSLADKKETTRLYGQIAIGITLVEDVSATAALIIVSALGRSGGNGTAATAAASGGGSSDLEFILKGVVLAASVGVVAAFIIPKLTRRLASSTELLSLFAITWGFGVASLFAAAGFSLEIGALFAGVALAPLPYAQSLSTRLIPLRDFFVILFFIQLGSHLSVGGLQAAIWPAVVLSALVMTIKPLAILIGLGSLGYTKRTGFKTGIHLAQISEFSLVLLALAVTTGIARPELTSVITLTAMITITASTYLMRYEDVVYRLVERGLDRFERANTREDVANLHDYPLVLIGYRKGGHEIVKTYRALAKKYIVIDYDPEVIEVLEHQHIRHLYGDATDAELLDEIGLYRSELVVSTVDNLDVNLTLARHLNERGHTGIFICHASSHDHARTLYEAGAAYVMLPHLIGNQHLNDFIQTNGNDRSAYDRYREQHLSDLGQSIIGD